MIDKARRDELLDVLCWIGDLPSAQPDDLISRQAAIDALKKHRALFCDNTPNTFSKLPYSEKCRVDELDNAIVTLVNLPSAESEIIRCKDCKHRGEKPIADGRYWCDIHGAFMCYCSDAERRTE